MRRFISLLFFSLIISQIGIAQWHPQKQSITDKALNDVILIDENIGWAVGYSGTIIKTTLNDFDKVKNSPL